jgi:hypothetical protein
MRILVDRAVVAAARVTFVALLTAGFAAWCLGAYVQEMRS